METPLDQEIHKLKVDVLKMLHMAQDSVHTAVTALMENDADKAQDVIDTDRDINDYECRIDTASLKLLALRHPVAKDLRFIVGSMRMIVNIERLGDEAVNVAERVLVLHAKPRMAVSPNLKTMADMAQTLLRDTLQSYMDLDSNLAKRIVEQNAAALDLNVAVFRDATTYMIQESRTVDRAIQYSFIAHSLKRICDQCANIAESVIFIKEGENYKHKCASHRG